MEKRVKYKMPAEQLLECDRLVYKDREVSTKEAILFLDLKCFESCVNRYIRSLGWNHRVTQYCQYVSIKNKYERLYYCLNCVFIKFNQLFLVLPKRKDFSLII